MRAYVDCLVADPGRGADHPARRRRHVARGQRAAQPHPPRARRSHPRPLGPLRRRSRGQSAGGRDLGRRVRHPVRVDGAPRRDEPARRSTGARARARHRDRSRTGVAPRRVKLGIVTPGAHALAARARAVGGDGDVRRHRRDRAGGRTARLPPLHVQRARRGSGRRRRGARRPLLRPARDVRRARRAHDVDPLRRARARARLPPPARDRQALRHARRRHRRTRDPRRRRRLAAGGVRAARRAVRRPRRPRRRRDARAARRARRNREPEYHGEYYDFDGFLVDPCAVQAHVPMWVGGRTYRSLRRAVELGDGWAPFGLRTARARGDAAAGARHRRPGPTANDPRRRDRAERAPARPDRRARPRRRAAGALRRRSARPASTSASSTTPPPTTTNNSPPSPPSP